MNISMVTFKGIMSKDVSDKTGVLSEIWLNYSDRNAVLQSDIYDAANATTT
jgi:hypothetical protein